jgi:hypothetical protein
VGPHKLVDSVHAAVRRSFDSVDLGQPTWFLGVHHVEIAHDKANRTIALSQSRLIRKMLTKFKLADCRRVCTPLDPETVMSAEGSSLDVEESVRYAEMVGCLLYVAVWTRPGTHVYSLHHLLCQVHVLPHQGADEECGARL